MKNVREYAEAIAKVVGGEVQEVPKGNGVIFTGIMIPNGLISPVIYVNNMYEDGVPVEEATERVREAFENSKIETVKAFGVDDLNDFLDYEKVKGKLRARLYNNRTKAEVYVSAEKYGFDDLIIVPVIQLTEEASTKVTNKLLEEWGVSVEDVIAKALVNVEAKIMNMSDFLPIPIPDMGMKVITTETLLYGAIGAITLAEKLEEMYPDGYILIPSSINEMIVIPNEEENELIDFAQMICEVNNSDVINPEEILGNKAYRFVA